MSSPLWLSDRGLAQGPYPAQHMRGSFSNGPSRAGKKRNEFFNDRAWLQKKEDR